MEFYARITFFHLYWGSTFLDGGGNQYMPRESYWPFIKPVKLSQTRICHGRDLSLGGEAVVHKCIFRPICHGSPAVHNLKFHEVSHSISLKQATILNVIHNLFILHLNLNHGKQETHVIPDFDLINPHTHTHPPTLCDYILWNLFILCLKFIHIKL